jgi:exonuclease III
MNITPTEIWSKIKMIVTSLNVNQDFGKFHYTCEIYDEDDNEVKVFDFYYKNIVILNGYITKPIETNNVLKPRWRNSEEYFEYSNKNITEDIQWDLEIVKQYEIFQKKLDAAKKRLEKRNKVILKEYKKL